MSPEQGRALAGIRILEVGAGVAAAYAAKLLADLGAEVIKVEPPDGDPTRRRPPFAPSPVADGGPAGRAQPEPTRELSTLFLALNTNKRSVVVDPEDPALVAEVAALAREADIIITDQTPAALEPVGLGADGIDELRRERPGVVVCSITPFGLTGPYATFQAEELTVANAGGWAYLSPGASDDEHEPPLKVFGHQTQLHAGITAALVCLAAFDRAEQTGVGDLVDFSSMAHTAGMLEAALIAASYLDENPSRLGSRLLNPWKIFEARDGRIFLVTVEEDQWQRLVELMGHPEWTETGLFDTVELRHENEDLLHLYLQEWIAEQEVDALWRAGQAERICFAPVFTMADLPHQDHLADRGFLVDVDHPHAGRVTHLGAPFRSSADLWGPLTPAPPLDPGARPRFGPRRQLPISTPNPTGVRPEGTVGRPLEGVRVLDLSWVWAGPYATLHLAHLGAEVIKVESASRPGLGRRLPLHPPDVEPSLNTSAYFNQWDQGKLSCQLDLGSPRSIEVVEQLVAECDVVVENFATGVMERLGLGYDRLREIRPDLIVASISGYGSSGPLKEFMGYGPTTGPLSGLSALTGYEGGTPRELGISVGDPAAGITAALAIGAALVARRRTGEGCYLDVALWEATASFAVEGWMAHAAAGLDPGPMGNRDLQFAPHNCYRAADEQRPDEEPSPAGQWLSIVCATDDQWEALAHQIAPGLADDPRFATAPLRKEHEDALDQLVGDWVRGQNRWEATTTLQAVGVAAFPSMSPQDLLHDEHLWSREFFERLDHPEVGRRVHAGIPWRSATGPNGVMRPAPLLGQHTEAVLGDLLGLRGGEIAQLSAG